MNTNILSPLQYLALGQYVNNLIDLKELASTFGTTTDIMSDIVKNTDIRRKLSNKHTDAQTSIILDEFAKEVEKVLKIR